MAIRPITTNLLRPKPKGEIQKLSREERLFPHRRNVERLGRLLAHADLLDVETLDDMGRRQRWLLVPVGNYDLDWLATFNSADEDREPDTDREGVDEREPDDDEAGEMWTENIDQSTYRTMGIVHRQSFDEEPSVTFADRMDRDGLKDEAAHPTLKKQRARYQARRDDGTVAPWFGNWDRRRLLEKLPKRKKPEPSLSKLGTHTPL